MAGAQFQMLLSSGSSHGAPVTIWGPKTLGASNPGWASSSMRNKAITSGAGGNQVRVTFQANASAAVPIANASIGKWSGSSSDTVATPIQLFFSGSNSATVTAGTTLVSDWANFTVTSGDTLVVIFDTTAGATNLDYNSASGGDGAIGNAGATYNLAAGGLGAFNASRTYSVTTVETRT